MGRESASRSNDNSRSLSLMDLVASDPQRTSDQHSSAVWGPVATLLWALVIAIVFLIVQIFVTIIYAVATMSDVPQAKAKAALRGLEFDGTFLSVGACATLLVCVPLILGLAKLKSGSKLKDYLGLVVPRPRQFLVWSLITSAFCVLTDLILWLLDQPTVLEFMLKAYASAHPRWLLWLALAVCAPVFEEICFRGFLFKGLAASRLRWQGATVVTSVFWAAIHVQYDWYGISTIFALGLVFGTARAMTNSTLLTMWLHCLVNVLATAQTAIALRQI